MQEVELESADPAFAGSMKMTWSLAAQPDGTQITGCENVPVGIRKEVSTLDNLAAFAERAR